MTATPATGGRRFWRNAQFVRLISAYFIVYLHLEPALIVAFGDITAFLGAIRVGTDVFLVLSGFLSAYLIGFSKRTAAQALLRRCIRIIPLYWIFTIAYFLFRNVMMSQINHVTWLELLKSMLFIPYGPYPVLYPTWSLVLIVEFAIIVAIATAIDRKHAVGLAIALTVTVVATGTVLDNENLFVETYASPLLLELAAGACLALAVTRWTSLEGVVARVPATLLGLAALGIVVVATATLDGEQFAHGFLRLGTLGLAGTLIVAASLIYELKGIALNSKWVDRLAKYTFCIYLCHLFWNIGVERVAKTGSVEVTTLLVLVTPLAVTIIAALSYHLLEDPIARALSRTGPRP